MKLNRKQLRKMILQELTESDLQTITGLTPKQVAARGGLFLAPSLIPVLASWLMKKRTEQLSAVAQEAWDALDDELKDGIITAVDAISAIPGLAKDAALDAVIAMLESWKSE